MLNVGDAATGAGLRTVVNHSMRGEGAASKGGDDSPTTKNQDRSNRSIFLRLVIALSLGVGAAVLVMLVGILFFEGCPVSETGGFTFCLRAPRWLAPVTMIAFLAFAGFGWWISGIRDRTR